MGFSYKNSKGITYYLHQKEKLIYFSKDAENSIDLPEGYAVAENIRSGLPILKKEK